MLALQNTYLWFMRRRLLFLCCYSFLMASSSVAQDSLMVPVKASVSGTLITLQTYGGSTFRGLLLSEKKSALRVYEFNVGEIQVPKAEIKNQESLQLDSILVVETINGMQYTGRFVGNKDARICMVVSWMDTLRIPFSSISNILIRDDDHLKSGAGWFQNPNATRYFFAPSAIPLRKKEGYFQNAYLLANSANVGITNNLTVGGGVVIPLLFYITPKLSYKISKHLHAGVGLIYAQSFISSINLGAGIGYGLVTVGNAEHNLTFGAGYGYARSDNAYKETPMPVMTINGMTRLGKKVSLVTENWFIPRLGYNSIRTVTDVNGMSYTESYFLHKKNYAIGASAGLRLMPGLRSSIDFAVVALQSDPKSSLFVLPYLDFVYKFDW